MKRSLLIAVCLALCASLSFAQGGSIMLFNSTAANDCDMYDSAPGLISVYVIHMYAPCVTASEFMVGQFGTVLTYIADTVTPPFLAIGNSQSGITIAYGGSYASPIHILTIQYFGSGISPPCTHLQVVAHPAVGAIQAVDCATTIVPATGGDIVMNPVPPDCVCNIPVKETTWGQLKSLYE